GERVRLHFGAHLGRLSWQSRGQWAVSPMTPKPYQERRRKFPRGRRVKDGCAPTEGRGMEMPIRPVGLDPIVAEIIEALARTIVRDEDGRASLPLTNKPRKAPTTREPR